MKDIKKEIVINVSKRTLPVTGLLGATLVVLKALGMIDISWWWATAPFWIGPAIGLTIVAIPVLVVGLFMAIAGLTYAMNWLYHKFTER